jgi:hypothetical protein
LSGRLLALALVACWLVPAVASAQSGKSSRVELLTAGPDAQARQLESVLRELIGYLSVSAEYARADSVDPREVVTPVRAARPVLARVWIDLSQPERATVYIVDGPWERVLVRHVPLKGGVDEVAREQLAHIVSSALEALSSGARIGLTREEVEHSMFGRPASPPHRDAASAGSGAPDRAKTTEPSTSSSSSSSSSAAPEDYAARDVYEWHAQSLDAPPLDLGLYYELQAWSHDQLVVHGPGAALRARFQRARGGPGIWLSAQYRFAVTVDEPPIGVRLHSGAGRALGTFDWAVANRTELRAGLGIGLDVVDVEPRQLTAGAGTELAPERTTLVPLLRALVALEHRFVGNTAINAALALDLELIDARYVVERDDSKQLVFDPWTLRPAIVLGISSYVIPLP